MQGQGSSPPVSGEPAAAAAARPPAGSDAQTAPLSVLGHGGDILHEGQRSFREKWLPSDLPTPALISRSTSPAAGTRLETADAAASSDSMRPPADHSTACETRITPLTPVCSSRTPSTTARSQQGLNAAPCVVDCRICLSSDSPGDLVTPCACSGSLGRVHIACLRVSGQPHEKGQAQPAAADTADIMASSRNADDIPHAVASAQLTAAAGDGGHADRCATCTAILYDLIDQIACHGDNGRAMPCRSGRQAHPHLRNMPTGGCADDL